MADAAAARFAEKSALFSEEISLLRKRVANSYQRERGLRVVAKDSLAQATERAALLHEVNHRAKNSIQMAISLLNLQRHASDDPKLRLSLASAVERLSHIARVHSMLYGHEADKQAVNFGEYLTSFCGELHEALAGDVEVVCRDLDDVTLDASRATNLALIASEGITNALKHAFPEGRSGKIFVDCRRRDEHAILAVQDNGIGMKEGADNGTLGLKLIRTLVKGIGGKLRIDGVEGTRLRVTFPL